MGDDYGMGLAHIEGALSMLTKALVQASRAASHNSSPLADNALHYIAKAQVQIARACQCLASDGAPHPAPSSAEVDEDDLDDWHDMWERDAFGDR